ncbi:MAG: protein kinase [Gemmatimonadaceae bacterium]|nr:protein kinase [Gemmatimonadaceae bacterium]
MPDPVAASADTELLARVERVLAPQYELDRELGRGGMGIVYRARDTRLKRTVAVKLLPPELAYRAEIRSRFLREAEMAAQLSHPNIVPIYAVDERDGLVFFVMACIDGDNLARRMASTGPMPTAEVRRLLREIASALAFAHARKFIHRDIKPDNILLDADDGRAIVTDFGIARAVQDGGDTRLTATGMAIGTPAYMSPEQCAGEREVDGRADLYALGVLAYQMLAGRLPLEASSTPALLVKQLSERPVPIVERRPDTPPDLAAIVMRLLEKEPDDRFPTAEALVAALDGRSDPFGVTARTAAAGTRGFASSAAGAAARPPERGATGNAPYPARDGGRASAPASVTPAPDDVARWYAPQVIKFRKGLAPFFMFAVVSFIVHLVGGPDFTFVPAFWSIGIAMSYARLWQAGFDWRDVFKQPREALLMDFVLERFDALQGIWNPVKREQARERARERRRLGDGGLFTPHDDLLASGAARAQLGAGDAALYGASVDAVRGAVGDQAEIARLLEALPKAERKLAGDVGPTAAALAQAMKDAARQLAELERAPVDASRLGQLDAEIARLEHEANPLDPRSEERVRTLARLRRERRELGGRDERVARLRERMERARTALQSLRLDLLKLRGAPAGATGQVTQLAARAQELARDVDAVIAASARTPAKR